MHPPVHPLWRRWARDRARCVARPWRPLCPQRAPHVTRGRVSGHLGSCRYRCYTRLQPHALVVPGSGACVVVVCCTLPLPSVCHRAQRERFSKKSETTAVLRIVARHHGMRGFAAKGVRRIPTQSTWLLRRPATIDGNTSACAVRGGGGANNRDFNVTGKHPGKACGPGAPTHP